MGDLGLGGFMFATGIENSYPVISDGKGGSLRRDQMAECGHYGRWREDFALVRESGLRALRWGPPLHLSWTGPGRHDWSYADAAMAELARLGIEPIVDLCHFGVPDWVGDFQNPDFPELFEAYAAAFAARFPSARLYTPVNEIHIAATFSARLGWWNERLRGDREFVTALRHLARANVLAMRALLAARPDAVFVQSETAEHFHAGSPSREAEAARKNQERFLSLDLVYGRPVAGSMREFLGDNGMPEAERDFFLRAADMRHRCVLGLDYYVTNEPVFHEEGGMSPCGDALGFHGVAAQFWDRYRLPLLYSETNHRAGETRPDGGDLASDWLAKQWACVRRLMQGGIPVLGFTWYSLTDQIDWHVGLRHMHAQVNPLGLYDLDRRRRPVGDAFARLAATWRDLPPGASAAA